MILITGQYHDPDTARRAELVECLRRNAEPDLIQEIHVFAEDSVVAGALKRKLVATLDKIRFISHGRRVSFRNLFDYANQKLKGGATTIIANADIYFDETLARLNGYDLTGRLLCLSRWDVH